MTENIQKAIADLHDLLNEELGNNVVSCRIFISSSERHFEVDTKSPAQLKGDGISMKNIKGEWIKK